MGFTGSIIENNTVRISSGETGSEFFISNGLVVVGLILPTMTSTAVSFKTFAGDGTTAIPVYMDDGTLYSATIGSNRYVSLDLSVMNGLGSVQVVGGSTEGADRDIILVTRPV